MSYGLKAIYYVYVNMKREVIYTSRRVGRKTNDMGYVKLGVVLKVAIDVAKNV